jgi:hypothetical protein
MTSKRSGFALAAILLSVSLLPSMGLTAEPMARQYQPNQGLNACQAVERLADFLSDCQIPAGDDSVGWTWQLDQRELAPNMAGLVSLSLLDAYQATGKLLYLRAAQRYADGLMTRPYPGQPYKPDVELMVRLYGTFDDPDYRVAARDLFARIQQRSPSGADEVARIEKGRQAHPALLGYDVAMAIRAALSVDERAYAFQLADALIARSGFWYQPKNDARFTLVSAAALVSVLEALDEAHFRRTITRFRRDLLRAQSSSGAWHDNETQPTAHAALALLYSPQADERRAAQRGISWLKTTLLQAGSLATYNDKMPEPFVGKVFTGVNAEALTALSAACSLTR